MSTYHAWLSHVTVHFTCAWRSPDTSCPSRRAPPQLRNGTIRVAQFCQESLSFVCLRKRRGRGRALEGRGGWGKRGRLRPLWKCQDTKVPPIEKWDNTGCTICQESMSFVCWGKRRGRGRGRVKVKKGGGLGRGRGYELWKCLDSKVRHS